MIATLVPLLCFTTLTAQSPRLEDGDSVPAAERELIARCLEAYDRAWKQGEEALLAACFCPKSPCLSGIREEAIAFLRRHEVTSCRSILRFLARAKTEQGPIWGAYIHSSLGAKPRQAEEEGRESPRFERMQEMDLFLLIRPDGNSGGKIIRIEDFDPELTGALRTEKLGCPACNYELGRPQGWFLLPRSRGWGPCTDSLSLLHPSGKIVADFDIVECHSQTPLEKIVEMDQGHLAASCTARPEQMKISSRKSLAPSPTHQGIELEGSIEQSCEEGTRKIAFWRVYYAQGPVLYSLNVYGEAAEFLARRTEIDALRQSFKIANPKLALEDLRESMKSRHNPGGKIDQNSYVNRQYGVRVQGPNGWRTEDFSGPSLFLVRFFHPKDPAIRIAFHAMEDPNGWPSEESVQKTLEAILAKRAAMHGQESKSLEAKRLLHRGLQAFSYEAEWIWPGPNATQERICLLPAGSILYVLEIEAPANRFEELGKTFRATLDSLSRF